MITNDDPAERHGPLKSLKIFTKQKISRSKPGATLLFKN